MTIIFTKPSKQPERYGYQKAHFTGKQLEIRRVMSLFQAHTVSQWQSQDSSSGCSGSEVSVLPTTPASQNPGHHLMASPPSHTVLYGTMPSGTQWVGNVQQWVRKRLQKRGVGAWTLGALTLIALRCKPREVGAEHTLGGLGKE